jgi:hypothetical protein
MINRALMMLKGTSGTGKSTRMNLIVKFLTARKKYEEISLGYIFKDLKLIIMGKSVLTETPSGVVQNWNSLDSLNSKYGTDLVLFYIRMLLDKGYNVLCEGEPCIVSHKYRPILLQQKLQVENLWIRIFNYTDKDQYLRRIMDRNGKEPRSNEGWLRNRVYRNDFNKIVKEAQAVGMKHDVELHVHSYNKYQTGVEWFNYYLPEKTDDFKKFHSFGGV